MKHLPFAALAAVWLARERGLQCRRPHLLEELASPSRRGENRGEGRWRGHAHQNRPVSCRATGEEDPSAYTAPATPSGGRRRGLPRPAS